MTEELCSTWARIQADNQELASPYFCPEFTQAVSLVRGDVFVGVLEDGGSAVGFFPFQRGRFSVGRPVGGPLSDFQALVIPGDAQWDPLSLLKGCRLSAWDFDHALASQFALHCPNSRTVASPVIELSNGFEAYVQDRRASGSEQIKKIGNLTRRLERELGPIRFEVHESSHEVLHTLLKWKSIQYSSSGIFDVFSVTWTIRLLEQLLLTQASGFAGMLSTLRAGDHLIAAHMGMRSKSVWHYWFPAYDAAFHKYSPGLILLLRIAQAAPALGVRLIDLGKGDSMYKHRLATGATLVSEGTIEVPSFATVARGSKRVIEHLAKQTPLRKLCSIPGRLLRRLENRSRFS